MDLGIYISVPFCRSKCSYCNFASGVFSAARMEGYVSRVTDDIHAAPAVADQAHALLPRTVDSIYFGGGTPSLLAPAQLERILSALRERFVVSGAAEITVECAPGMLSPEMVEAFVRCGVNRVSLGVQSFVDAEAKSVGRLHGRADVFADIARLRSAGIRDLNLDLIAGLPHQTASSWRESLVALVATAVPHASVYMLEVDEDSRLGRELLAGGVRYHAHHVPDNGLIADLYSEACEVLPSAGIAQYEISNFARPGSESRHNLKYWQRQPYLGFGLDAHSMLSTKPPTGLPIMPPAAGRDSAVAMRFSTTGDLDTFLVAPQLSFEAVNPQQALEEEIFLGLRLNRGISRTLWQDAPEVTQEKFEDIVTDCLRDGLLSECAEKLVLTHPGRMLSNEIFVRFLGLESSIPMAPAGR